MSLTPKEELELARLLQWERWMNSNTEFIEDCCWTRDEADRGLVKKFPPKPYLRYVDEVWMRESLLVIPKSRRMMMTWRLLANHLWAAMFQKNRSIFIQSKKAEDSDYLVGVERFLFMYSHLPAGYPWPRPIKTIAGKSGQGTSYLSFSNGTSVKAIAEGPDQLRQYTASYVYITEMAFFTWAEQTWGSLKPTIDGGGRITVDSSANPGFFERLCKGDL